MINILKVFIVLFVCSINYSAIAQKNKLYLESNKTYPKGRIYIKKSLVPIFASKLILTNDTILNYTDSGTGMEKSLNLSTSQLNYIKMKTGTKAGAFALYGGLVMGLISLLSVGEAEQTSIDMYGETSDVNWLPIVGGFTAGGALIGAVIGAFSPKYKNFYIKNNNTTYKFGLSPYYYKGGEVGIAMHVIF